MSIGMKAWVGRLGRLLQVLGIARISTVHQDVRSLADQEALLRRWLDEHVGVSCYVLRMMSTQGSGERLDRPELIEAAEAISSGQVDLVIAEDLGRIMRRMSAFIFCEFCEEKSVRLVALNDNVDTGEETWRTHAFFAAFRHEMYNADTGKRIRRTERNRFSLGGMVKTPIFGIEKPPGAKTDCELRKAEGAQAVYDQLFSWLEAGVSFAVVADRLNELGVKPGQGTRQGKWTGPLVRNTIFNRILKGVRVWNERMSQRVNSTGKRRSIRAPASERLERLVPHLAFIEPGRYDRLIAQLTERNKLYKRKLVNGRDPRCGVPKKRTKWPGQHLSCGVCGRKLNYGGHGEKDRLLCAGAYEHLCWQAVSVNGAYAAETLTKAILEAIEALPDFEDGLREHVAREWKALQEDHSSVRLGLERKLAKTAADLERLADAMAASGHSETLINKLKSLEEVERVDQTRLAALVDREPAQPAVPPMAEVKVRVRSEFERLSRSSPEFGQFLRRLVPELRVYPVRLCDGGHLFPQARFTLSLVPLLDRSLPAGALEPHLTSRLVVTLAKLPQRAIIRADVVRLRDDGVPQREIARQLGVTQPAVQAAEALHRTMMSGGLSDPLVLVEAPPHDYPKLCRHLHARYRFEPLLKPPSSDAA